VVNLSARPYVQQVNLRQGFGTGEVFTATLGSRHVIASFPFGETVMHGPHLAQFSEEAFVERVRVLIERAWNARSGTATGQS
jgi:hypothetical protein